MKPHTLLVPALLIALLSACGTGAPTPNNPAPGNPTNPSNPTQPTNPTNPTNPTQPTNPSNGGTASFKTATLLPEGLKDLEQDISPLLVQLVEIARNRSNNAATLTGTLTQVGNTGNFNYSATPTNGLRIVWGDGAVYEFVIARFQGSLASGANAFYKGNHLLEYTAKLKPENDIGNVNLSLRSQRQGTNLAVKITGTALFENLSHALNLDYVQVVLSEIGNGSITFHHQDTLQGSINGPAVQIQVSEAYDFKVVGGSSSLVMQTIRSFNNAWTEGGQQFRLQNGLIKKVFRDGSPIERDFWTAQGDLLRGGVRVGGLGQAFSGNLLEQFLDTPNGRIRLGAAQF